MKFAKSVIAVLLFFSVGLGGRAGAAERPPAQPIAESMSCGVCGMYPARFPEWQTQLIFKDGTMVPFDGAKDMFKYLLDMAEYTKARVKEDVVAVWVKDHATGEWIEAEKANFVVGSKAVGPMGSELVPFASARTAQEFQRKNGGSVIPFVNITLAMITRLGMSSK
jgi:nitrous oxide reductase accessory protein NosL